MKAGRLIGLLILSVMLSSCGGTQQTTSLAQGEYAGISRIEGVSIETVQKEPKVASGYANIILHPLQMSSEFAIDYPEAANQFNVSMLAYLKDKNAYTHVEDESSSKDRQLDGRTMIADVKVIDMRIVSTSARIWGGALAGSSFMDLYLKLTDAASKKVIHEKVIATNNNAFASAWSLGSENSLPMDMGKIIGEYIYTVVSAN